MEFHCPNCECVSRESGEWGVQKDEEAVKRNGELRKKREKADTESKEAQLKREGEIAMWEKLPPQIRKEIPRPISWWGFGGFYSFNWRYLGSPEYKIICPVCRVAHRFNIE